MQLSVKHVFLSIDHYIFFFENQLNKKLTALKTLISSKLAFYNFTIANLLLVISSTIYTCHKPKKIILLILNWNLI